MRLELHQRPVCHRQMVQVVPEMLAAMAFRDVRGNRHCGLSQLTPQSVGLALRERRTEAVDLLDEFDRGLPDLEVSIAMNGDWA